jgi:WD40 repeat protein
VRDGELLRTVDPIRDVGDCKVVLSPDGTILASGKLFTNIVYMWQLRDGQLLQRLQGHTMSVRCVAFSPDGTILASGDNDGTILLWEVRDGRLLRTLDLDSSVECIAFSPDGKILASGDVNGNVIIWQVRDGELLLTMESYYLYEYDEEGHQTRETLYNIAFSPDGTNLACVGDNNVRLWRLRYGQLLQALEASGESVAFSPDGTILAVGGYDGIVRLWEVRY